MITTRTEKLEQLLTENCRDALTDIDRAIQLLELDDLEFNSDDRIDVILEEPLEMGEAELITQVLDIAGWKSVLVRGRSVQFYF